MPNKQWCITVGNAIKRLENATIKTGNTTTETGNATTYARDKQFNNLSTIHDVIELFLEMKDERIEQSSNSNRWYNQY